MGRAFIDGSFTFTIVLAASVVATRLWIAFARSVSLTAPKDPWHDQPVAQSGGAILWLVVAAAALVLGLHRDPVTFKVLAGGGLLAIIGFVDDRRPLKPNTKLILQLAVAVALLATSYARITRFHLALAMPVAALWLVGQSNAVNLLDNMDGACPTVLACMALGIAVNLGGGPLATLCIIVAGASLGFLAWNRKPARVFLGDTGSLSLGFVLGAAAMWGSWFGEGARLSRAVVPALLMLVPLFNVVFVIITRRDAGVPVSRGLGDHLNYRLVAHGASVTRTLAVLAALSLAGGALAWAWRVWSFPLWSALVGLFALALAYLGVFLSHADVENMYERLGVPRVAPSSTSYRTQRRRVFELVVDVTVASAAFFLSFQLRFEGELAPEQELNLLRGLPFVIMGSVGALWASGLYRVFWRYVGIDEVVGIARAAVGVGAFLFLATFAPWFHHFPRSIYFLFPMLLGMLAAGYRVSLRVMHTWRKRNESGVKSEKVLIVGAGDAGELALRGLQGAALAPCGFLDDDPEKIGLRIHGVPVLAPTSAAIDLATELGVVEVIVAMPTAPIAKVNDIVTACEERGIRARLYGAPAARQ